MRAPLSANALPRRGVSVHDNKWVVKATARFPLCSSPPHPLSPSDLFPLYPLLPSISASTKPSDPFFLLFLYLFHFFFFICLRFSICHSLVHGVFLLPPPPPPPRNSLVGWLAISCSSRSFRARFPFRRKTSALFSSLIHACSPSSRLANDGRREKQTFRRSLLLSFAPEQKVREVLCMPMRHRRYLHET